MLVEFVSYLYLRLDHIYARTYLFRMSYQNRADFTGTTYNVLCVLCKHVYLQPLPTVLCVSTCLSTGISEVYVLLSTDVTNRNSS